MYSLLPNGVISRDDGVQFKEDPFNKDWVDYQAWLANGGVPSSTFPLPNLLAYASNKRWEKETGGLNVDGIQVATDDRSKLMIMGARLRAMADEEFTTPWVAADGQVFEINAAQIIAISDLVAAHVNECFTTFATVKAGIAGGTITSTVQIDSAFA